MQSNALYRMCFNELAQRTQNALPTISCGDKQASADKRNEQRCAASKRLDSHVVAINRAPTVRNQS